jgi:hypothetical protein
MKYLSLLISSVLALGSLSAQDKVELVPAFNGKDLAGWKAPAENDAKGWWKVQDGLLVGENDAAKKGSMIYTEKSYKDVIFEAEVRWTGDVDTGFMMRKPEIQMQLGISRSLKKDMSGSFYNGKYPEAGQAKESAKLMKKDDWNKFRLQAKGDTFTVWINGEKAAEYTDAKYAAEGPIGLQIHPGVAMKVEFRNIQLKPLP